MKVLVVLGFCFAVASATPAKHLNLGREPVPAERTYYGKSYDLGTLGFRYYAPYYYDTPYYGYGDGYYNNYYTNRYYKTPYYGDKTQYYGDKTQYYGDKRCDETDGGKAPRIPLNDGNTIPALGLGTFLGFDEQGQKKVGPREIELPVTWALNAGYRLIDTASIYGNEDQIGVAIQKSDVPREDIFIVTKLSLHEQRNVVSSLKKSLAQLNTPYVDLFLIHFPVAFKPNSEEFDVIDYLDTWKGMEEAKRQGLAKSIGISNFNISQIERLLENSEIKPAVLQVEVNLNLAQNKLLRFAKDNDITVMAYSPFGSLFTNSSAPPPPRVNDRTLRALGEKYGKTVPQIVLRYLVQRGVIPIPKSTHKERIEKNVDVFDFKLSPDEMDTLSKYNKDYRLVWPSFWQDHPYYPFEKKVKPDPNPFHAG